MNKTVADLALRWLARNADALSEAERRVLKAPSTGGRCREIALKREAAESGVGDRVADAIARIGGSWIFIIGFLVFLFAWTALNTALIAVGAFDPYPFIFLNLILSMLAALQAPVIMMSQNRQAKRDRRDAAHDYEVNLKAEIEIMALHEKLDELRHGEISGVSDRLEALRAEIERLRRAIATQVTTK